MLMRNRQNGDGEIQGLLWENYRDGELYVSRSIWNGRVSDPKTRKGRAPVPVVRQLADRLEIHRVRSGNPQAGPIFANSLGQPLSLGSVDNRVIFPALNQCAACGKAESDHQNAGHRSRIPCPEWSLLTIRRSGYRVTWGYTRSVRSHLRYD